MELNTFHLLILIVLFCLSKKVPKKDPTNTKSDLHLLRSPTPLGLMQSDFTLFVDAHRTMVVCKATSKRQTNTLFDYQKSIRPDWNRFLYEHHRTMGSIGC